VNDKGRYRQFQAGLLWAIVLILYGAACDRNSKSIIHGILKFLLASYVLTNRGLRFPKQSFTTEFKVRN